tara:strand:+ start:168 stop:989 length:822 start_codon:yes stop_codon:yes gene_type:complete
VAYPLHVIGSTGFIGKSLQKLELNDQLVFWSHRSSLFSSVRYFDLYDSASWEILFREQPKKVLLLSWPGLPDFNGDFHLTKNVPQSIRLISRLIDNGCESITVTGTCYEYGMKSGALKETDPSEPVNLYGIAKDSLRKSLASKCLSAGVKWSWLRIFYPYGEDQNPRSLYPSLIKAISHNDDFFPMSSGRQIRDFIFVDDLAKIIFRLAFSGQQNGIVNLGSGIPLTLQDFAMQIINSSSSKLRLNLGEYPDRNDEPHSFWADISKLNSILSK